MVALEAIKRQPEIAQGLGESNGLLIVPAESAGLLGSMATILSTWGEVRSRPDE
jgi:hypothetical protein